MRDCAYCNRVLDSMRRRHSSVIPCLERRTAAAANSIPDAAASIAIRMRVYLDLIHLIGLSSLNVGIVYGQSVLIICVKLCK